MILKFRCINFQKLRYAFTDLFRREALVLLIYMAASASVLNISMQTRSFEEGSAEFGFSKMLDESAERPHVQQRRLVPIIANYAASLVSREEQAAFVQYPLDRHHLKQLYFEIWSPEFAIKYHVAYFILFFSLLGTLYCLRALTSTVSPNEYPLTPLTPFVPVLFILLLPLSFLHGNFSIMILSRSTVITLEARLFGNWERTLIFG